MSEDEQRREHGAAEAAIAEPLAGERLAAARRDKQISVDEIAKELHIDEYKVRALERNDFEVLGAPVFAKGHLRKYSQLVGVRVEDVLADYYSLTRAVGMPPLVGRVRPPSREINLGRWLWLLLLLAIAGAAYWWFFERATVEPPAQVSPDGRVSLPAQEAPAESGTEPAAQTPTEPLVEDLPVEPAGEPALENAEPASGVSEDVVPPRPGGAEGEVRIDLTFSGDSWTEITDASGERLFFGLGREGRTVSVSGTPPLSVLLGNANNVSLKVDGADYPIRPADRRGLTARFSIQAS
jgi:cytoskeleton protein RodZ